MYTCVTKLMDILRYSISPKWTIFNEMLVEKFKQIFERTYLLTKVKKEQML